jgi:hypothetical protein
MSWSSQWFTNKIYENIFLRNANQRRQSERNTLNPVEIYEYTAMQCNALHCVLRTFYHYETKVIRNYF